MPWKTASFYPLGEFFGLEMTRIIRGMNESEFEREANVFTFVNVNSPLQFDAPMLWGMIELARRNQLVAITPFTLAGIRDRLRSTSRILRREINRLHHLLRDSHETDVGGVFPRIAGLYKGGGEIRRP